MLIYDPKIVQSETKGQLKITNG